MLETIITRLVEFQHLNPCIISRGHDLCPTYKCKFTEIECNNKLTNTLIDYFYHFEIKVYIYHIKMILTIDLNQLNE
ncbi:hypothetical protein BLOT_010714 [Blomia tropicalis]|nr:hypothetical protein BLOT_010714 [Blomia tropicalis]